MTPQDRPCSICKKPLPPTEEYFPRNSSTGNLRRQCRECYNARCNKRYHERKSEEASAHDRRYRHNPGDTIEGLGGKPRRQMHLHGYKIFRTPGGELRAQWPGGGMQLPLTDLEATLAEQVKLLRNYLHMVQRIQRMTV